MVSSQGTFSDSGSWVWASSASSSSSICPCKAAAMVSTRSWRPANKGNMPCVQDVNEHLIQQTKKTSGGSKESFAWTGASTRMKVLHREDSLTMAQHGTTGFVGVWCVCAFWIFLVPFCQSFCRSSAWKAGTWNSSNCKHGDSAAKAATQVDHPNHMVDNCIQHTASCKVQGGLQLKMNEHEHEHNTKLLSDLQVKSRLRDLEPGEHSYGTMCLNQSYAFRRFLASLSCRLTSQTLWRSKHLWPFEWEVSNSWMRLAQTFSNLQNLETSTLTCPWKICPDWRSWAAYEHLENHVSCEHLQAL